jgi:ubiquinol oxidase
MRIVGILLAPAAFSVTAFAPAPSTSAAAKRTPLLRVATTEHSSSPSTDARGEKAIQSLEQLLSRQQEEIQETQRLLNKLKAAAYRDKDEALLDVEESRALSVAESILTGTDYGFRSRSEGASFSELKGTAAEGYGPPANLWALGTQQFMRNLRAMQGEYREEVDVTLTPKQRQLQEELEQLTLNSTAIWEREEPVEAPVIIKIPYLVLCWMLDVVFEGRYVPARFFLLETVARMPYFSYLTMLHLYETLGFWRRSADMKRVHFAEELNEFRHLLIMESLGGDQRWWVRFLAQHSAIAYYIGLCFLWAISPSLSYKFSEMLESHAVNTYGQFLDENEGALKKLPPSTAAIEYYSFGASDPFYAEFQTSALSKGEPIRRPGENMKSLYDVFVAIRADEGDHVSTMQSCLDPQATIRSISLEKKILFGTVLLSVVSLLGGGDVNDLASPDSVVSDETVDALGAAGEAGTALDLLGLAALGSALQGARQFLTELAEDIVQFML